MKRKKRYRLLRKNVALEEGQEKIEKKINI